jgi:hypothetical protein
MVSLRDRKARLASRMAHARGGERFHALAERDHDLPERDNDLAETNDDLAEADDDLGGGRR